MRLSRQFQGSLIFFYNEKVLSIKKDQNAKQTTCTLLEVLACIKNVAFVV